MLVRKKLQQHAWAGLFPKLKTGPFLQDGVAGKREFKSSVRWVIFHFALPGTEFRSLVNLIIFCFFVRFLFLFSLIHCFAKFKLDLRIRHLNDLDFSLTVCSLCLCFCEKKAVTPSLGRETSLYSLCVYGFLKWKSMFHVKNGQL